MSKKRKIAEKIFMLIILALFAAFLFLWLKSEEAVLRYIVGAILLLVAIIFKIVDKKLAKNENFDDNNNEQKKE